MTHSSLLAALLVWLASASITLAQATRPAAAAAAAADPPPPPDLAGATFLTSGDGTRWKLVWNDEFSGQALDRDKWSIGLPWGGTDGTGRHHNEQYASYILDHNIAVDSGALKLLTRREDVVDKKGRTFHFTQGLITTAKSFRHRYGYWEARVKLPVDAGPGLWPAFWTLAEGWPPEMDICEIWTSNNRSHQGLCYRPSGGGKERWDDQMTHSPLPTGWTVYGMEWGPGYQVYHIDGKVTKRVYGDHVTDDRHYILLNSGVESGSPPTAATVFPNTFAVDYVRVYERPEGPIIHNDGFESDAREPWGRAGQAVVVGYDARTGKHALRVDGGPSTSEQKIYGLKPRTPYRLTGWIKPLTDAGEARLGVKNHGGEETFAKASGKGDYQQVEVSFTTGENATTATIYCQASDKAAAALFDDVAVR
ncbi:MAG TPA: family 16 glycosylhydrolase [Tepidisphaeraceae bacterium]|nr:family 16 glycosylhydrolase [Tepidisphaeraceae bacterium]